MRILLSILSDYLQPNFLLIKELEGKYDRLIFMTTAVMEEKKKQMLLVQALGVEPSRVSCIVVVEDNYDYIIGRLKEQKFKDQDEFILNITGGTKLMAIAVYEFFKTMKSKFFYVPIGKNYIVDLKAKTIHNLNYQLKLEEYLLLNSLHCECDSSFLFPKAEAYHVFAEMARNKFEVIDKIKNAQSLPTPEERRYYSGAWFEDYVYLRIKDAFGLTDDKIGKSVKIFRDNSQVNDNEIDVAFVKDNMLSIIECKVSMFGHKTYPKDTVEEYLYKLAAIAKDLGLRVNSYLFTLHIMKKFSEPVLENIHKRADILGIKGIIDGVELSKDRLIL